MQQVFWNIKKEVGRSTYLKILGVVEEIPHACWHIQHCCRLSFFPAIWRLNWPLECICQLKVKQRRTKLFNNRTWSPSNNFFPTKIQALLIIKSIYILYRSLGAEISRKKTNAPRENMSLDTPISRIQILSNSSTRVEKFWARSPVPIGDRELNMIS